MVECEAKLHSFQVIEPDSVLVKDPIPDAKKIFRPVEARYPGQVEFSEAIEVMINLHTQPVQDFKFGLGYNELNSRAEKRSRAQQEAGTPTPALAEGL